MVGAFVREDAYGQPREIHLLVHPGPEPRHFARDVKGLLEERLGIPIDQRIISIAQLARDPGAPEPEGVVERESAGTAESAQRLRFLGSRTRISGGRVSVHVMLESSVERFEGEAEELESGGGRARAGAGAALAAATAACRGRARIDLVSATVVRAAGRPYVVVSATASSPSFGRRPLNLAGAHGLNDEPEVSGALAALKSANRVLARLLSLTEQEAMTPPPPRHPRRGGTR